MEMYDKLGRIFFQTLQCLGGYYDDRLIVTWWYRLLVESMESLLSCFKDLDLDVGSKDWPQRIVNLTPLFA